MSRYVVYESHMRKDDKCEMPDMKDFAVLKREISGLKELCSDFVTSSVLTKKIKALSADVDDLSSRIESQKKDLIELLTRGNWKRVVMSEIDAAIKKLDERYAAINEELSARIEELAVTREIESGIDKKIVDLQSVLREIIQNETSALRSVLENGKKDVLASNHKLDECRELIERCLNSTNALEVSKKELAKEVQDLLQKLKSSQEQAEQTTAKLVTCEISAQLVQDKLARLRKSWKIYAIEYIAIVVVSVLSSWLVYCFMKWV